MRESKRLEIKNLTKTFITKVGKVTAVKDVNLTIEPGEFVCLLGPSGCGKTTLGRTLTVLYPKTSGEVIYNGVSTNKIKAKETLKQPKN